MKYEKPELVRSGAAAEAVLSTMTKSTPVLDNDHALATTAAYEADE